MFQIHEETTGTMHCRVTHFIRESPFKPFTLGIMGNLTIAYTVLRDRTLRHDGILIIFLHLFTFITTIRVIHHFYFHNSSH